jgi:MFS family permease
LQAVRQSVHQSFQVFLVIYLSEGLDYTAWVIGLHVSLITLAGIVSTPILGAVSDRIGRKPVIVASMAVTAILVSQFLWIESGWPLAIALTFLGLVLFAVMPIIAAAAMDQTEKGSEGSSIALMFAGGAMIGALAPIGAGAINQEYGWEGVVLFACGIAIFGTVMSLLVPIKRTV